MKALKISFYVVLFFVLVVAGTIFMAYLINKPRVSGTLVLQGLQGPVTIERDQYGVPHIYASKSDNDAFFALGYVHAQDRFWQMEFQRRVAQGTLSEIFGKATLQKDEFLRTFGFYKAAESAWPALDPQTQSLIHSYTEGVNAYLAQGHLPLEIRLLHYQPQAWTDIDSIAWSKLMAFDLQSAWKDKIVNYLIAKNLGPQQVSVLLPQYSSFSPTILSTEDLEQSNLLTQNIQNQAPQSTTTFDGSDKNLESLLDSIKNLKLLDFTNDEGKGSNDWVVNGNISASKKPLLADDPHLSLQSPGIWYLAELKGPHLHVIGATIPGLPAVLIGHNDHIAWGVTNVNPDTQDLYFESPSSLRATHEIIKVRGEPDVNLTIYQSVHGPIINDVVTNYGSISEQPIALKWTALMPGDTTVKSFLGIDYAQNWQQFTVALQYFVVPSQNFVYADQQGNIGYYVPGKIPVRNGWSGEYPIEANQHFEWDGYIPFNQLPHVYNPKENLIATANNAVVNKDYPYALTFRWREPPYRIERILDLLKQSNTLTVNDFEKIQNDTDSYLWRDLKPELMQVSPTGLDSRVGLQILQNWNGNTDLNSQGALIFAYWYKELIQMPMDSISFGSDWPEPLFIKQQLATNGTYCQDNPDHSCRAFLSDTLNTAMQNVVADYGNDPKKWHWDTAHRALFKELGFGGIPGISLIWNRSIQSPGGLYTVDVGTYDESDFVQNKGAGYRQIVDLNNFNNSKFIQAFGQSENIFSPHYDDFMAMWRDGKYLPMTTDQSNFGKTEVLTLLPN